MAELEGGMTAEEFGEWMAMYRIDPWGTWRDDFNAGIVASTIANANRNPDKRSEPYMPKDFMPIQASEDQKQEETESPGQFFGRLKNGK